MPIDVYGLGIDIGDATVRAAACPVDAGRDGEATMLFSGATAAALTAWSAGRTLGGTPAADDPAPTPRGVLDRVGAPSPLRVADRSAPAEEIVAWLVGQLAALAHEQTGQDPAWTVIAVPPAWGGHRVAALARALATTGLACGQVSAAVAAVRGHVATGELPADATAVVVDVGASTADVAVVGPGPEGEPGHVTVPPAPVRWGGRDVDDAVLRHVRRCLDVPVPADRTLAVALRATCTAAKEAASSRTEVDVAVDPAWSAVPVRLTREELEDLVADGVDAVVDAAVDAADGALAAAGAEPSVVVLAGGTVRVPLVAERLSAELRIPLLVGDDPAVTTALGAARAAADVAARPLPVPLDPAGEEPAALLPEKRGRRAAAARPRGRTGATGPAARSARPARTSAGRLAVVAGMFLGLVLTPPVLLSLLGADRGGAATGSAVAAADDGGGTGSSGVAPAAGQPGAVSPAAATSSVSGTTSVRQAEQVAASSGTRATTSRSTNRTGPSGSTPSAGAGTAPAPSTAGTTTPGSGTTSSAPPPGTTTAPPPGGTATGTSDPAVVDPTPSAPAPDPTTDPAPVPDPGPPAQEPAPDPGPAEGASDPGPDPATDPGAADPGAADPGAADPGAPGPTPVEEPVV